MQIGVRISGTAQAQEHASAWTVTEHIKCYIQTLSAVWMSEYRKARAVESGNYGLCTAARFSRFLGMSGPAIEKAAALLDPWTVRLFLDSKI